MENRLCAVPINQKMEAIFAICLTRKAKVSLSEIKRVIADLKTLLKSCPGRKRVALCLGTPDILVFAKTNSGYEMGILIQKIKSIGGVSSASRQHHLIKSLELKLREPFLVSYRSA